MIVTLDGKLVTGAIDGAEGATFTEQREEENGRMSRNYSAELTFYGDGYSTIRDKLITPLDGKFDKINVKVYDDCCKDENGADMLMFEGIIRGDAIDWCADDCSVTCQLIEETEETEQMNCVKSTLIFDDQNGFQSQDHPRMHYCIELRPNFYQDVIIILGILLNIILLVLTPIVAIISVIIRIVAAIPGVNLNDELEDGILDDFLEWRDSLNESLIGCGREHPSPLVRSYMDNVCDVCGLQFESSIFKNASSEYHNTVVLFAPVEKGTKDDSTKFITQNRLIKTGEGFLEDLRIPFNAKYRIEEGVLRFERRDYFDNGPTWFSYAALNAEGLVVEAPCYNWRAEDAPAAFNFKYTPDPVDWVGNEALPYYDDVVGVNDPYSSLQKGVTDVILPYGAPRFRDDLIDRDVVGSYGGVPIIKKAIENSDRAMVMNNGTCFNPKLLIWDGVSISRAKVQRWSKSDFVDIFDTVYFENYPIDKVGHNWPYQFNEEGIAPNTAYDTDEPDVGIYARFHSINHPKVLNDRGWDFTVKIKYTCELLRNRSVFSTIELPEGTGRIDRLEINIEEQTILITGKL